MMASVIVIVILQRFRNTVYEQTISSILDHSLLLHFPNNKDYTLCSFYIGIFCNFVNKWINDISSGLPHFLGTNFRWIQIHLFIFLHALETHSKCSNTDMELPKFPLLAPVCRVTCGLAYHLLIRVTPFKPIGYRSISIIVRTWVLAHCSNSVILYTNPDHCTFDQYYW